MRWQAAFDAAVLQPLRSDHQSAEIWRRYRSSGSLDPLRTAAGRGQLARNDDRRRALWGAFRYQRYHADAMTVALQGYDSRSPRVCLDLGCGAGTVGVALHEVTRDRDRSSAVLDYIGVDHNPHARSLARDILTHETYSDIRSLRLTDDLGEAIEATTSALAEGHRPIVTMSHLLHQEGVTPHDINAFAASIVSVVNIGAPTMVPLVITDIASTAHANHERLISRLARSVTISGPTGWDAVRVTPRFPNLYPDKEGWFEHQRARFVHRWILRLVAR